MITSLTSPKIAKVRRLLETHSPGERGELGQFVVEGLRAVEGALASTRVTMVELFVTSKWLSHFPNATEISEDVAKRISDTVNTQGIFAVFTLPDVGIEASQAGSVAIFFEIQDPGNAGTVIRNARAFGIELVLFTKGSVDPFSAKVVRSSAGTVASQPILTDIDGELTVQSLLGTHQVIAFDMQGSPLPEIEMRRPLAVLFGNEARGLPDAIRSDSRILKARIPMPGDVESLNVASAATVAMFEISQLA